MGRGARSKAGLKVRQPLDLMKVMTSNVLEKNRLEDLEDQLRDELNVKKVQVTSPAGGVGDLAEENFWDWTVSADMSKIGPRFTTDAGDVVAALTKMDPRKVVIELKIQGSVVLSIAGTNVWLSPEEIIRTKLEPAGYSVTEEGDYVVAIDSTITQDLADEGLARELVHCIQNLRRGARFDITDRIVTYYQGPDRVREISHKFADYIQQETLSEELVDGEPDDGAHSETQKLEGMQVVLGVRRVAPPGPRIGDSLRRPFDRVSVSEA